MKKITLQTVCDALENQSPELKLDDELRLKAVRSLERMHEL